METLPGHRQRLPAGQDPSQVELLSRKHRDRILVSMAEIVAKRGYRGTTIEHIVKRAVVSRGTFYGIFDNREDCLLAGFEAAVEETRRRTAAAAAAKSEWADQIRAGIAAFLDYVASEPALARTCIIETMTAGPAAMERYEQALQSFAPAFRQGRELAAASAALPDVLEDSIVGGIVWMVHQSLLRGEAERVPALLPTMLEFALAPYLGPERAAAMAASPTA